MAESLYDPGSKIRLHGRFKVSGALADPTTVQLRVQDPAGAVTTYDYPADVTKSAVGRYLTDVVPTLPGRWFYKYIGTAACQATREKSFRVRQQVIA